MVSDAISCVGERGSVRDVLRSPGCDPELKEALAELMVFTTEAVGTDGARAKLRHEQKGFGLAFGSAGGFLTPSFAEVRSPLVVVLHGVRRRGLLGGQLTRRVSRNAVCQGNATYSSRRPCGAWRGEKVAQLAGLFFSKSIF